MATVTESSASAAGDAAPAAPELPSSTHRCPFCYMTPGRANRPSREVGRTITACSVCYEVYVHTRKRDWRGSAADLNAFLARAAADQATEKQEILEHHLNTDECYCGYADPGFPGDSRCYPCQAKAQRAEIERKKKARIQSALPDDDPEKVFSEAEISDERVQADKNGFNRVLLRDIRIFRGIH
jgi:hypothetical protein